MVIFEALIQFVDLRMMRNLWEPSLQAFINARSVGQTAHQTGSSSRKRRRDETQNRQLSAREKLSLQIVKEIPHVFHLTFRTKSDGEIYKLWASIRPEHLTINSEDLTMKYGAVMDGLWQVVGIVDANVGEPGTPYPVSPMIDGVMTSLTAIREQVGRPRDHFGLTVIAIYSHIKGSVESEVAESKPPEPSS